MISVKELLEKYENVELDSKTQKEADQISRYIDERIEDSYIRSFIDNGDEKFDNSLPTNGFSCHVYLKSKLEYLDNSEVIRLYLLQQYSKKGWEISSIKNNNWKFTFNLAALRDNSIDELLED